MHSHYKNYNVRCLLWLIDVDFLFVCAQYSFNSMERGRAFIIGGKKWHHFVVFVVGSTIQTVFRVFFMSILFEFAGVHEMRRVYKSHDV